MKKQLLIISICLSTISCLATDLYVNSGGVPNTYLTLQDAINVASDGDNIYMSVEYANFGPATVDKSVYIISQEPGENFQFSGEIFIANNIDQVTIIGANGVNISTLDDASSRINVHLISSTIQSLSINHDNYKLNVYDCNVIENADLRNGVIVGSQFNSISISDEENTAVDTIKLIANEFQNLTYSNSIHSFEIFNNYVDKASGCSSQAGITINSVGNSSNSYGIIANNEIQYCGYYSGSYYAPDVGGTYDNVYPGIRITPTPSSFGALTIVNNYININSYSYSSSNWTLKSYAIYLPSSFPNVYIANNGYENTLGLISHNEHFTIDNFNSSASSDAGLDQPQYYDIDGSINDVGRNGGPHAWSQYHTSGGKAVILDLEIPSQFFEGTSYSVKAKAVHKN